MRSKDVVTVEYDVEPEKRTGFLEAIRKYGRIRHRDGAYQSGVFRDAENWDRYVKTFLVVSLAEHLRQLERLTRADRNT
jgi:Transmembrane secretion effector